MKMYVWLIAAILLYSASGSSNAEDVKSGDKPTFWIIPHTHWEGAVFKTREEYLEMGLPNILKAMRLLRDQPTYRYTLDQVAYIRPFLERYPEEEPAFRRFLAQGRLQIVGGLDIMPDDNMPGGETFIRQLQYGKGYCKDKLGIDVTTGWLIDSFGHHAQLPQMLKLGGFHTFWFVRGVPKQEHPAEFLWEGIDGTRIPAFYLPHSYALMYPTPRDPEKFRAFARARFSLLDPNSPGIDRVAVSAADVSEPEEHQAGLVERFNARGDEPIRLRIATPADYESVVAKRKDRPVFRGELNPIFQGIYSSRIELKSWMRMMEQRLLTAEKLGAVAMSLGNAPDTKSLWRAWEPVLFNETHDLASGVMTDHVYEDTIGSYEFSKRLADQYIDEAWQDVSARVDTSGTGAPVLVFNTLGWERDDIAEVEVGFDRPNVRGLKITDDQGAKVPSQVLANTSYPDSSLKTARVAFVARGVPALGYRTFHIMPDQAPSPTAREDKPADVMENGHFRLTLDPSTGSITKLHAVEGNWEVLAAPGNVVAREQDKGDLWELYRGLNGGSRVAMKNRQAVPRRGVAIFSDEQKGSGSGIVRGDVLEEFQVQHEFGAGRYSTRIRLYRQLRRVEVETRLVNRDKFVRYQVLFPTTIKQGHRFDEIPLGAIERPEGIEFPAQNWVDYGDGRQGLAILNTGLPGHVVSDGTLMVSLLRAHSLGAYGFGGGYEPGMSSESGYQLGKERVMRYALVPHAGDWRTAGIYREGLAFNHPLISRKVLAHPGPLPARHAFFEMSPSTVVLSSCTPGPRGDILIRLYEATGQPAKDLTVKLRPDFESVSVVDFLDRPVMPLKADGGQFKLEFQPFEIKTIRVERSE